MTPRLEAIKLWLYKTFYFSTQTRIDLYDNIHMFIDNGVSVHESLVKMSSQLEKHSGGHHPLAFVMRQWAKSMDQGKPFEQAMKGWLPDSEQLLFTAGADNLNNTLGLVSGIAKDITALKGSVKKSISYPLFSLLSLSALLYIFTVKVIPGMTKIIPVAQWPESTRTLYDFTQFLEHDFFSILFGGLIVSIIIGFSLPRLRMSPLRSVLNKLPPWSLYNRFQGNIFMITIASVLKSGRSFSYALKVTRENSPPYIQSLVEKMESKLSLGKTAGESMASQLFDKETLINLEIYSDTNNFEVGIFSLATKYMKKQIEKIEQYGRNMGMLVMLMVVFFIAWFYISLIALETAMK